MDYNHIKDYLNKFKEILFSKEENLEIISKIIEKNISIKIETRFIKINNLVIYIKTTPLIHGEILINKNKILEDLSQLTKNTKYKDIR